MVQTTKVYDVPVIKVDLNPYKRKRGRPAKVSLVI